MIYYFIQIYNNNYTLPSFLHIGERSETGVQYPVFAVVSCRSFSFLLTYQIIIILFCIPGVKNDYEIIFLLNLPTHLNIIPPIWSDIADENCTMFFNRSFRCVHIPLNILYVPKKCIIGASNPLMLVPICVRLMFYSPLSLYLSSERMRNVRWNVGR